MTEPTPGPWDRRTNGLGHVQIVQKRLPDETEFNEIAMLTNGPTMANAQVIVNAGNMLIALEQIELWSRNHPNGTCEAINAKARAAIAKARNPED